jgi:hypothetical protein
MRRVVLISALVHLAAFVWLARTPPPVLKPPSVEAIHDEVTIEMETEPAPTAVPAARGDAVAIAVARERSAPGHVETAPIPSGADAPVEAAPYASNGTIIVFAPNIGVGGPNPFLLNGVDGGRGASAGATASADPMYVPLEKRAEQSVKDALRARDQSIGLGLEGPVVHALEDATHAGFAPERGTATFVAVIDERGLVVDLKILSSTASSSNGARGWEDVRQRAVKSLATAKIDMRGVKRAELKIAVESEVLLPSGNKPDGPKIHNDVKPTPMKVETNAPPSPGGADVVAGAEVAQFDVTDVGAKKQRVVHAKLVLITTR